MRLLPSPAADNTPPHRTHQPPIRSRNIIRKAGPNLSRAPKIVPSLVRQRNRSIGLSLRDNPNRSHNPAAPAPTRSCVQIHTARSRAAQPTVLRIP